MKAYLMTVLVLDHEGHGLEDAENCIESVRNWYPTIISSKEADIGEWSDEHPLNSRLTVKAECDRLFAGDSK
jgi:hypothetical protein